MHRHQSQNVLLTFLFFIKSREIVSLPCTSCVLNYAFVKNFLSEFCINQSRASDRTSGIIFGIIIIIIIIHHCAEQPKLLSYVDYDFVSSSNNNSRRIFRFDSRVYSQTQFPSHF
jgi:hypothetical protein